ncbi:MAG: carboxymuconolactone decarboxylase family protein [Ignavibacteriales bacterium]
MAQIPKFVEEFKMIDEDLCRQVTATTELAMQPGALDVKTKLLITLALDSFKGAGEGVKVVAAQARAAGATDQEMAEAIRLAYFVAGLDVIKTGLNAFNSQK